MAEKGPAEPLRRLDQKAISIGLLHVKVPAQSASTPDTHVGRPLGAILGPPAKARDLLPRGRKRSTVTLRVPRRFVGVPVPAWQCSLLGEHLVGRVRLP